ncbi:outer membrane protein assembly factor BamD [Muricauda sp. SYSU M84420]|uniref:Outer membrane protein assembly factor BamD n=2 Tax=Flagellimonas halotolerans TaxID=3112164 RepID=A0ABU6IUN8_9FLAO|nr:MULTISPECIES: outer membrane protein assembly factor BamD [unclassified Allomuricauda]MEC3966971.1 outer membrane protein assembly factor BamD [Muricauda sp. SYSU M86414]MEC4266834.1 outer membrane protein assembly factor BamD [Muricauda sp. SYSU M84420]
MRSILLFCCAMAFLVSCSEYQKVLKETDVKAKYDMAEKLYNEGDYKRAVRLFEQIAPKYVGKPQGERVMFFFADSYFKNGDYYLSGYQFERFIKSYPRSDKIQEASFLGAKSYYMLSPRYSLDQTETDKALLKLQTFINNYSESEYFEEANAMAKELTTKKEKKQIEIAKQFNKLGKFNLPVLISAITAFDNFITDNPGSVYREEALYYRIEAATELALNSTMDKKKERLEDALDSYNNLMRYFPESKFKKEADQLAETIQQELSVYSTSLSK